MRRERERYKEGVIIQNIMKYLRLCSQHSEGSLELLGGGLSVDLLWENSWATVVNSVRGGGHVSVGAARVVVVSLPMAAVLA